LLLCDRFRPGLEGLLLYRLKKDVLGKTIAKQERRQFIGYAATRQGLLAC